MKAFLITLSFVNSIHDECLFIKKQDEKKISCLCMWVDDSKFVAFLKNFCDWFYAEISKKFKISDYSDLTWFLGKKNDRTLSEIKTSQEKYVKKFQKLSK